jgi:peptidoglycan hydrolase-like protein with peptidoglycan-binding domain
MKNRISLFTITIGLSLAAAVRADDNVREVQTKLSNEGLYSGEVDGAYSPDLSAALTRYQVRKGLPITGQLDVETADSLGAKPAVGPSTADAEQGSETWRRLRKHERRTSTSAQRSDTVAKEERERPSPGTEEMSTETRSPSAPADTARSSTETTESAEAPPPPARTSEETTEPASAPPVTARTSSQITESAEAPPPPVVNTGSASTEFSTERMRDYVAAFVLAGVEKNVGAEAEFFADRVEYYDQGTMDREKIREDLKRYDEHWPERHFWIAGTINVEPQTDNRVRVTFPLGFKLRNANKNSSGKVNKTLVLERAGDDLQIVAVNEVSKSKK